MCAYILYIAAMSVAAPVVAILLALRPRHRSLLGRFAPRVPAWTIRPLWVHACSVGEVNLAKPILQSLQERCPDVPILLTVSTVSGRKLATETIQGVTVAWLPLDHPLCMRPFLKKANPRALILLETELWPTLIRSTHARAIPIILANGRISDKYFPRYRRIRWALRPILRMFSAAAMQNQEYANRIVELGAEPSAVHVCGNTKFDGVRHTVEPGKITQLRAQCGFNDDPILLFGSTRPGDEALAAQCWAELRDQFPSLHLIIAPRHLNRLDEALAPFNEPVTRRSRPDGKTSSARVFCLDTVGELVDFYALATVAVVGGSFFPGVNGHNPMEPAALGVPTVFGPYMRNFADPVAAFLTSGGAIQVAQEQLTSTLRRLLASPEERNDLAEKGPRTVQENQGAIKKTLDIVERFLA